jgi:hypothetical protein
MFLDLIRRRNPQLIEQAISLHQQGKLPANVSASATPAAEAAAAHATAPEAA